MQTHFNNQLITDDDVLDKDALCTSQIVSRVRMCVCHMCCHWVWINVWLCVNAEFEQFCLRWCSKITESSYVVCGTVKVRVQCDANLTVQVNRFYTLSLSLSLCRLKHTTDTHRQSTHPFSRKCYLDATYSCWHIIRVSFVFTPKPSLTWSSSSGDFPKDGISHLSVKPSTIGLTERCCSTIWQTRSEWIWIWIVI